MRCRLLLCPLPRCLRLQARQTLEVEATPLLAPVAGGQRGRGPPPAGPDHSHEPIDWLVTSLLFFFPAVGGLLFGWVVLCGWRQQYSSGSSEWGAHR